MDLRRNKTNLNKSKHLILHVHASLCFWLLCKNDKPDTVFQAQDWTAETKFKINRV